MTTRIAFEHRHVSPTLFGAPLDDDGKHLVVGAVTAREGDEVWELLLTLYSNGLVALEDGDRAFDLSPACARRLAGYLLKAAEESEAIRPTHG